LDCTHHSPSKCLACCGHPPRAAGAGARSSRRSADASAREGAGRFGGEGGLRRVGEPLGFGGDGEEMGRAQEAASISFDSVRDKNVMQLRKLNTAIFPVTYQDKFYTDALNSGDFTKLGMERFTPWFLRSGLVFSPFANAHLLLPSNSMLRAGIAGARMLIIEFRALGLSFLDCEYIDPFSSFSSFFFLIILFLVDRCIYSAGISELRMV
jgi:hypothetical protein